MKSNDFGNNDLGGKELAALIALKYDKNEVYKSLVKQIKEEKIIETQKLEDLIKAQNKEREDKRNAEINAVKQHLPGIELLHDSATITLNGGPWVSRRPELNLNSKINVKDCADGIYVVCDSITLFQDEHGYGKYYSDLTTFEKKGTQFNILLCHSFYSGLTTISYGSVDKFNEYHISDHNGNIILFNTFMKNNKTIIEEFVEKNKNLLNKPWKQEFIRSDN